MTTDSKKNSPQSNTQRAFWIKVLIIFGLFLLLQIPMMFVQDSVKQRSYSLQDAKHNIEQSYSKSQSIVTPILAITYQTSEIKSVWDKNLEAYINQEYISTHTKLRPANQVLVDSNIQTSMRKMGIFNTPVFESNMKVSGNFEPSIISDIQSIEHFQKIESISLITFINDLRGITSIPQLNMNEDTYYFEEGTLIDPELTGLHTNIPLSAFKDSLTTPVSFNFVLPFKGTSSLSVYPVGQTNEVNLSSNWPHPSFNGKFLPVNHDITNEGFSATWKITSLSSNLSTLLSQCESGRCQKLIDASLSVNLFEPVNHYTLSERAIKYGNIFILLTFIAFFMFEIFKSLSIHPLQYFMVGLSLTMFFLLLIALSEHFNFAISYIVSSLSCIGLITLYTGYILKSFQRSLTISSILLIIYFALYFILHSEDYAFLMGSILIFSLLAITMLATRKLDWYNITSNIKLNINKEPTPSSSSHFNKNFEE
ncbi:cell envelope integrity protein CreD [Marinicellulosiphila megalodicopiae]|uniref:cell envelope integrity protein CreD n=1 Tax=Marinicellulosiphila megalodicopiae TaxID=2724896 RepID=UPI003BB06291